MSPLAGFRQFLASHTEMSSARHQKEDFPGLPTSLNAGDHEMRDWHGAYTPSNTTPYYTPYLGLRARLSQVWINRWTILLLLVLLRLLLLTKDLNSNMANAKAEALSACTKVEDIGSAMASMPHYMSEGVNALAADTVTHAVNALMDMLMLTLTGMEEIVLFLINMYTQTYACLITLAISGSLHVAIQMIEDVGAFMNKTIGEITDGITTDVSTFESGLNSFLSGLKIPAILGGSSSPPQIDLSSDIAKLKNIQVDPTTMDADLTKLNASIPTFAQVQNFTNTVISIPFEEVKKLVNESMASYTFDKSVFPLADKQSLTFCSDNSSINNFFDGLVKTIFTARTVFIVILLLLAILACIPMTYREIAKWRQQKKRSVFLQEKAFDPMDVMYIASRPYSSAAGVKLAAKFDNTKRQILTRWFVAYATSLPALLVLALGMAGLFSCLCQYTLLKAIEKEVPALQNEVGDFAGTVVTALNNASTAWATAANGVITSTNNQINTDVFGWVNTTTHAVNDTLNAFVDEMTSALNTTFGGTILYDPITEVINCLIGLKIAGIQKGLTWVSDNAKVTFPEFQPDLFSLGAAASIASNSTDGDSFLASPGTSASDDITNAVVKVAAKLEDGIQSEAAIAGALVGIWLFIVLLGFCRVLFAMLTRDKTRAEGGPAGGYTGDNRGPISPRYSPPRQDAAKFPHFGEPATPIYQVNDANDAAWAQGGLVDEKNGVGHVASRSVDSSVQPGYHNRSSSHGYVDGKR